MAKRKTPAGYVSLEELVQSQKEYKEKIDKESSQVRMPAADLLKSIQPVESISPETIKPPQTEAEVKEQTKLDKKTIEVQTKLTSNVEKLTKAISDTTKLASFRGNIKSDERFGARGKYAAGGRGEELANKQTIDYRTFGQRLQDKVMGRGQNPYDPNSLRWKLGSLRGLLHTTGLVTRGSGGFFDSMLARKEERQQGAWTLRKLNPNSKANYEEQIGQAQKAKNTLQREQDRVNALRDSGMSDVEIQATVGGSADLKSGQFYKRNQAAAKLVDIDPRLASEKEKDLRGATSKKQQEAMLDASNFNVSEEEAEATRLFEQENKPIHKLYNITLAENKRKQKADTDLLTIIKDIKDVITDHINKSGPLSGIMTELGKGKIAKSLGSRVRGAGMSLLRSPAVKYGTVSAAGIGAMLYSKNLNEGEQGQLDKAIASGTYVPMQTPTGIEKIPKNTALQVYNKSSDNVSMGYNSQRTAPQNNIVNAPTNITKQTQHNHIKLPIRDQDPTIRQYYRSRFAS